MEEVPVFLPKFCLDKGWWGGWDRGQAVVISHWVYRTWVGTWTVATRSPDEAYLARLGLWTEGCEALSVHSQRPIPSRLKKENESGTARPKAPTLLAKVGPPVLSASSSTGTWSPSRTSGALPPLAYSPQWVDKTFCLELPGNAPPIKFIS